MVEELEGAGVLGAVELAAVPEVSAFLQSYLQNFAGFIVGGWRGFGRETFVDDISF